MVAVIPVNAQQSTAVGGVSSCPEAAGITKTITLLLARSDQPRSEIENNIKATVSAAVTQAPYAAAQIASAATSALNLIPQFSKQQLSGGKLVKYLVAPGQLVSAGQTIALIELNGQIVEYKASIDGLVESTNFKPGEVLEGDTLIATIRHNDPGLTAAVVSAAVQAAPEQAASITSAAISAAPALALVIAQTAISTAPSQARAIAQAASEAAPTIASQIQNIAGQVNGGGSNGANGGANLWNGLPQINNTINPGTIVTNSTPTPTPVSPHY
jgi:biotin carboxyl carrier protein